MSGLKEKNIQPFEEGVIQGVQVRPVWNNPYRIQEQEYVRR